MIKTDYLLVFLMLTKCFGLTKCNVISFDLASGSIPKSGNSVELICELTSNLDNALLYKTINKDYNTKPFWSRCSPTACENFKQGYAVTRTGSLVSITIASVSRPEDEKWWTCISGNAIQFELIVYTVPRSVSLEDPERCDLASSTCVSTCTTAGCTYPEPTFLWYYSKNNDDTTERMFGSYGGTSTMQQDSCSNSEGLYSGKIEIPRYTTSPDITMKTIKLQCMMQFPKLPNGPRSNFSGPVQFAVKVSTVTIYNGQMVLKAGDRLTVTELEQETLRCEHGYGHPLPSLKWYIGETIKSSNARFSFTPSNSIHGQDVFCEASNIPGLKIDSVKVALYVKVKLKYVYVEPALDNIISVIENIPEPVVCATSGGRPSARIKWLKLNSGNDLGPSDSMKHIITEGDLNITKATKNVSVSRQHKGWILTCEAWNTDKSEYIQANNSKSFDILYPPEKMAVSYSEGGVTGAVINVLRGTDVSLKCVADSNPLVNLFLWSTPSLNFQGEILTIRNISNNQAVHCNARNTMKTTAGHTKQGSRSITKEINVLYEATITRFTVLRGANEENEDTFTVNENAFMSIVCNVDSNPSSYINLKQSNKLLSERHDSRILEYNISSANCSHNSEYTCKAQNKVKTDTPFAERKIQINVPCSPILAEETATTSFVLPNRSTILSVTVTAFPMPTHYSWFKNTSSGWQEVTNSSDIQITHTALQFNLTFRNARKEDYGEYNLTVGNGIGHPSSFLLLLQAHAVPDQPTDFRLLGVIESTALLFWRKGFNGGYEQIFMVQLADEGQNNWSNKTTVKEFDEHNLLFDTAYIANISVVESGSHIVRLVAANPIGHAEPILLSSAIVISSTDSDITAEPCSTIGVAVGGAVIGSCGVTFLVTIAVVLLHKYKTERRQKKFTSNKKTDHLINSKETITFSSPKTGKTQEYVNLVVTNSSSGSQKQVDSENGNSRRSEPVAYEELGGSMEQSHLYKTLQQGIAVGAGDSDNDGMDSRARQDHTYESMHSL